MFKAGDKIKCIDDSNSGSHLTLNKVYEVISVSVSCDGCTEMVKISGDMCKNYNFYAKRFKLYNKVTEVW